MLLPEVESLGEVGGRPQCDKCGCRVRNCSQHRFTTLETISNYRNSYPGFSSGRPRGTTPADDRYIVLQARRNRRQTAGEIARHTTQATGRPISRFTVARRLHGGGLFARRPVRCVPLTPSHRRRRSLWCREHRNWRDNEWGRVLFTDESRFSLSSDSHRILIWREREAAIIPRTSLKGTGSVNGTRYCNEILLPYVRLFRGAMGLQFLSMDDNAPCHRTVAAEQLLESEDIERMDWPARSPDLNPIEHVWDFLGRRLAAARTLPPVTIRELRLALQDEWSAMPQQLIDTLILSMGRRCETCLAVREIISPTKNRMFLAGHPSQGCFGLQSHCAPCYFFNQASFYPSDFSFRSTDGYPARATYRCPLKLRNYLKSRILLTRVSRFNEDVTRNHADRMKAAVRGDLKNDDWQESFALNNISRSRLFDSECHKPGLDFQTTVPKKCPAVQKMSRRSKEKTGTGKKRLYPLHKDHITHVTTSKARQGRPKSPGSPALKI
ncbi:transposable element Tcb2 transposase [Trichonephila clavipes]|nr:transposable element Tcb2 transposase [Trichonephila clavipes]